MSRRLTILIASVVLLLALLSIGRHFWRSRLPGPRMQFVGLGQIVAAETRRVSGSRGSVVAVFHEQQQRRAHPLHAEWESFRRELTQRGLNLAPPEVLVSDAEEIVHGTACSRGQLRTLLAKHAGADALVFFVGLPEWGMVEGTNWTPPPGPKLLVVMTEAEPTRNDYGGYFAAGRLAALIHARPRPVTAPPAPYPIYTPQNYESLPGGAE